MVWTVLKYVLIALVCLVILAWWWSGGFSSIANFVRNLGNPIDTLLGASSDGGDISLPWQIPFPDAPSIGDIGVSDDSQTSGGPAQYDPSRSAFAGMVSLSTAAADSPHPGTEYLILRSRGAIPIQITGWSLQSQLTGARAIIPLGAPMYMHGIVNTVASIELAPDERAVVTTSHSPAGVSFRENRCTGYLAQTLSFEPTLANACPQPTDQMRLEETNLRRYGGDCIDFVANIPQCTFPTTVPASLSPACRIFIGNTYSYNGCVQTYRSEPSFNLDTWRVYLGSERELWRNDHDVIRLLDDKGRIVDSITY